MSFPVYMFIAGAIITVLALVGFMFLNEFMLFTFLMVDYNLRAMYKPGEYQHASLSRYFKNFWAELYYVLGKYYLYPAKWCNLTLNSNIPADTAILLVHGYCRHQGDWLWMRRQLAQLNLPLFCVNLQPALAAIPEITKSSLPKKIASIIEQTKCKNIIVVAHSMGGLVSSYYSEFLDDQNLIKAIITIGTPYYGTKVSIIGAGKNAVDMCPGSNFLTELHVPLHKSQKNYYQICSKFDNIIFPWQSALFDNTPHARQYVLPLEAHLCMLHSHEVADQLKKWIKELIRT